MRNKTAKSVRSGILALAAALFFALTLLQHNVQAADQEPVQYQKVDAAVFSELIANREAPACGEELLAAEPCGYLFGGWFRYTEDGAVGAPITEAAEADGASFVYAKFVPARLTGVACQVGVDAETAGTTDLRVVSAVDSMDYSAVGFNVYGRQTGADGTIDWTMYEYDPDPEKTNKAQSKRVYSSLQTYRYNEDGTTIVKGECKTPEDIFGADAAGFKFTTMDLSGIPQSYYGAAIVIQPYWITLDGTYVAGNLEFNRVNDSPNITATDNIVNVSVNLQDASHIAAGMLSVTYPEGFTLVEAECGRVFGEMAFTVDSANRTVLCIGNVEELANSEAPEDVFVNLRFQKTDALLPTGSSEWKVRIPEHGFCSIDEVYTDVTAWNVIC